MHFTLFDNLVLDTELCLKEGLDHSVNVILSCRSDNSNYNLNISVIDRLLFSQKHLFLNHQSNL